MIGQLTKKCKFTATRRILKSSVTNSTHLNKYDFECDIKFKISDEQIDFKVLDLINRSIEYYFNNVHILNRTDSDVIDSLKDSSTGVYYMSLNGDLQSCEPTTLNITKEIFLLMDVLFAKYPYLQISSVTTWVGNDYALTCTRKSITDREIDNFLMTNRSHIEIFRDHDGMIDSI